MRGIRFAQIPTTLIAQTDSSVGGKTGVDFRGFKNIVGAFHQPVFVYVNVNTLASLPESEFVSGLGEAIKHGLIMDADYYGFIRNSRENIKAREPDALSVLIEGSCRIKANVVSLDEKERSLREILNFGHTFGHAVEALSRFNLPHGVCVALGMRCAVWVCEARGYLPKGEAARLDELLEFFGFPLKVPASYGLTPTAVARAMTKDKKVKRGKVRVVLLRQIGKAFVTDDLTEREIEAAIGAVI
jgi:3-dehydroquinate synthase